MASVTPFLNKAVGENNWKVELESPEKTLTVTSDANEASVIQAMEKAGYKAEKIN